MNEKDFLYTLKEYLRSESEVEILELLETCQLTFNYTSIFASKSWQFRAYVDIRVPISKLVRLKNKEIKSKLARYCGEIFIDDDQYAFYGIDIKPLILNVDEGDELANTEKQEVVAEKDVKPEKVDDVKIEISTDQIALSDKTVEAISQILTGDNGKSIYRKGFELVEFFNRLGFEDSYGEGFPTRIVYVREKIQILNQEGRIVEVLETLLDPRDFIEREESLLQSVIYLNKFLKYDGYMLVEEEGFYKLNKYAHTETMGHKDAVLDEEEGIKKLRKTETKEIKVFFSYSHKDEEMRVELEKHLIMLKRKGIINTWNDRKINAGAMLDNEIDKNLKEANIILLLVSVDFLVSDYCYEKEMEQALKMHEEGLAVVVPIILRPCDWTSAPFSKLLALPRDGKSVITWAQQDEAFYNIAKGIENIAIKL